MYSCQRSHQLEHCKKEMSNHGIFSYCILITCILKTFAFCSLKRREMYQMFQDNLTLKGGYFGNSF